MTKLHQESKCQRVKAIFIDKPMEQGASAEAVVFLAILLVGPSRQASVGSVRYLAFHLSFSMPSRSQLPSLLTSLQKL